ncbi:REP-associated tyrosine transposase [Crenobacter intestini]|uniref:Transposase n=1 Tax=Crenobacter intestini TaxID=2563443 RepID=A0A4T0V0Y6_9NEIS|nr:transposase [Crenobacter intestini]TIC84745.1 transposase [Crenobacter intestini]
MTAYRRWRVAGASYFFTVVLAERGSRLLVARIDALREAFACVMHERPFRIDAAVVLPDHLHCIWTLPSGDSDYPERWRRIKVAFTRRVPDLVPPSASRQEKGERGVWQRRYWEHLIRDEADWCHHVDYIHFNPVKHHLVARVRDWPYSSFHRFVAAGVYPADWPDT